MDYGFTYKGRVYTPDGTAVSPAENAARNAALEQRELADWDMRPPTAIGYFRFPAERGADRRYRETFVPRTTRARVTTCLGTTLGRITDARVYRHGRGGRFVAIRVAGTNGAVYHGRASWDHGTVITLHRRVKQGGKSRP